MGKNVKVIILCGGKGIRMGQDANSIPKPLILINEEYPILWHIMKIYAHYGFNEFILAVGYKGIEIKKYFMHYQLIHNDFTLEIKEGDKNIITLDQCKEKGWKVTVSNTGIETQTGYRIKCLEKYLSCETFMVTYGDGLADIDLQKLIDFHFSHGKIGTVTAVKPLSRFGELVREGNKVVEFTEKPLKKSARINGGFFVFNRKFLEYIPSDPTCALEQLPLENLAKEGQLMCYDHEGYWQCIDTQRDLRKVSEEWKNGAAPWKIWKD